MKLDHDDRQALNTGYFYGLIGVLTFALTLPATRVAVPYLEPVFIGSGRAIIAAFVAALILLATKSQMPNKSQLKKLVVIAAGVVIGFPILSAIAMQSLPASHGGVVLGILPLLTAFVGALLSGDRPTLLFWICAVCGSLIVVVFTLHTSADVGQEAQFTADLILFAAVVCAAIAYAMGGQLATQMGAWRVICWALVISVPALVWPAWHYRPLNPTDIPVTVWGSFLYLALFSQLLGFFAWYRGLALGGVTKVSQLQLAQPFMTIIASAFLLGELVHHSTWLYALAVVACVAISKLSNIKPRQQP